MSMNPKDAEIRDLFDELACMILGRKRFNELRERYPDINDRHGIMGACIGQLSHEATRWAAVVDAVNGECE